MAFSDFHGMQLPDAPTGAGGVALNENFQELALRAPKTNWTATTDPTVDDDVSAGYYAGSVWLNTSNAGLWKLVANDSGAADWRKLVTLNEDGKIPLSLLDSIVLTNTFVVASQVAMLALDANTGDVAIRTDNGKSYILSSDSPTTLADWKELLTTGAVTSVAGKTGVVTLDMSDISGLTAALAAKNDVLPGWSAPGSGVDNQLQATATDSRALVLRPFNGSATVPVLQTQGASGQRFMQIDPTDGATRWYSSSTTATDGTETVTIDPAGKVTAGSGFYCGTYASYLAIPNEMAGPNGMRVAQEAPLRLSSGGQILWWSSTDYTSYSDVGLSRYGTNELQVTDGTVGNNPAKLRANQITLTGEGVLVSNATAGAPFSINSTILNSNLNADLLDGKHAAAFVEWASAGVYPAGSGANITNVDAATLGGSSLSTITALIPTNTNQLTNGAGFITTADLSGYALTSSVPTNTNQLTNGAGFLTTIAGLNVSVLTNDAGYITSGLVAANNLSELTNAATARSNLGLGTMAVESASTYATVASVPTNTNQLTNGAGFLTSVAGGSLASMTNDAGFVTAAGWVADGTYTVGLGLTVDGTITISGGKITAIQQAS